MKEPNKYEWPDVAGLLNDRHMILTLVNIGKLLEEIRGLAIDGLKEKEAKYNQFQGKKQGKY